MLFQLIRVKYEEKSYTLLLKITKSYLVAEGKEISQTLQMKTIDESYNK